MIGQPVDRTIGNLVLGRYRVVRVLAHGGMGVVYLGRTEGAAGFSRPVVVKRILPHLIANPRMAGLFVREARILSELQHQGIVSILDFGEEDSAYLMVLEFVRGYDMGLWHRYLRETGGLMAGDVVISTMIKVLEALHYAHTFKRPDGRELHIVHRDISPGNILLDTDGHVKLLDFGIARFQDDGGEYRTRSGEFKGKAAYTPPEVFKGQDATAQADIFSAGVVAYKMLSGFNPFEGENSAQTMKRITDLEPPPISMVRTDVKKELDHVINRALAKNPEDRYQTAAEFAEGLRSCRRLTDEAAQLRLAADIQRDFLGEMPKKLGLEALPVLDAAWRAPSTSELRAMGQTNVTEAEATSAGTHISMIRERSRARRRSRNMRNLLLGGAATVSLVGVGLAIASVMGFGNDKPSGPPVVVVQRNPEPDPAPRYPEPLADPVPVATALNKAPMPEPATVAAFRKPRARPPGEPDPTALTRSFRKHQIAIERCFESHAPALEGHPEIAVQFQLETSGKVREVHTDPASIGKTPLGDCLLRLARATDFGPQSAALAFRIPLKARQFAPQNSK
ncbi:MAG: protein kinase [Deltaproteobacteria bacterium]|nr:protein kinase [Deltaproteobacteria bacterium]